MPTEEMNLEIAETEFAIDEFLAAEAAKDLLRFSTAGSVDDGKSTLIGRLLYDSRNVYEDQMQCDNGNVDRTAAAHNRFCTSDRWSPCRARARHYDRRGVSVLLHAAPQVHHRRHSGA